MSTVIYLENGLCPQNRQVLKVQPTTIQELSPNWQTPYVAFVDGKPILRADWNLIPNEDQVLVFIDADAIPQGGGGGGSSPLRTVLMLAVMYFSGGAASSLYGAMGGTYVAANASMVLAGLQAGIVFAGMALVNAVAPAPKTTSSQQAAALAAASPTYSLQAQGNSARLEAAIPEHFGRHIAYPDLAANPYTEYEGNEQYLYQLLCVGRGEYDIEAIKIEDTPIENFNEISYEIVPPRQVLDLFPSDVVTSIEVTGQTLDTGVYLGPFVASGAQTLANYIGIDFIASKGLYYANDDGSLAAVSITVVVEARAVDDYGNPIGSWIELTNGTSYSPWSDWINYVNPSLITTYTANGKTTQVQNYPADTDLIQYTNSGGDINTLGAIPKYAQYRTRSVSYQTETFTGATTTAQRYSRRYPVVPGRYEVRVKRLDTEQTSTRYGHNLLWGALRVYLVDNINTFGDVTLIGMRMRASDNLSNQASRKVNLIATRKLPVWNGSSWSGLIATRNPAWALAYAAKQVGQNDASIDLPGLLTLANGCISRGDNFDARFDSFISFWEAATKICGSVRAKPFIQGSVLRVVRDQAASIPVAMFSQRNIVKGSFSVNYLMPTEDTADSVDVSYFDEITWQDAKVRSTLQGSTAEKPAKVDLFGVINRGQAWREGLYQAACNRYRRKMITFKTEMEGFIPSFLDLATIQHDMPAWGQSGEVVAWNSSTKTLTLNEQPVFTTGTHYIALRDRGGAPRGPYACVVGSSPYEVVLSELPAITPYVGMDEERTHFAFGAGIAWSQPIRILTAKPVSTNQVEITAVNEDASVHTANSGVTMPRQIFSQLSGYQNAPTVSDVTAYPAPFAPDKLLVQWKPSPWATRYYVEQSSDGKTWTRSADVTSNSVTFQKLFSGGAFVRVAAVGVAKGPWFEVLVTPSPVPATVSNLSIEGIKLSWPAVSDQDIVGYRIKFHYGTNLEWGTANLLYDGLVTSSPYTMLVVPPGQITIMVRAVDSEGQESAESAYVIKDMGDPLVENVLETYDYKADSWPGAITNGSIISGDLVATQGDVFYRVDESNFYNSDISSFYSDNYDSLVWESSGWTPSLIAVGYNMTVSWLLTGNTQSIQYRKTSNNPFYGVDTDPFYSPDDSTRFYTETAIWQPWPGAIVAESVEYQWRVESGAGAVEGKLSSFTVSVDVPDKLLKLDNISISSGGTRLTGTIGQFNSIQNIQLTLQGSTTAMKVEVIDKSLSLGPLVIAKDASNIGVSATIDALIQGY